MLAKSYKSDQVSNIKNDGIRFAITVGRRQPMHAMHADSVREILNEGFFPIYVIGSVNTATDDDGKPDRLYDPIKNPLTYEQQRGQLFAAFPDFYDIGRIHSKNLNKKPNIITFPFKDLGNLSLWSRNLCLVLRNEEFLRNCGLENKGGILDRSVLHFRGKQKDRKNINLKVDTTEITMTNTWDINALREFGLAVWYSKNQREEQYNINSTELRIVNLESPKAKEIVAYAYIYELALKAREENPNKKMLSDAGIPLTMFDISLERLRKEINISTSDIFKNAKAENLQGIKDSAKNILRQCLG